MILKHFIPCVKPLFVTTILSVSFFVSSCSTTYCCVSDHDLQIYNISSDRDRFNILCTTSAWFSLKEFQDVFPKELLKGLPPKCNIDHHIDLISSTTLVSIPLYWLDQCEDDEIASWNLATMYQLSLIELSLCQE